ncbi:MAG: TatD family hydrolase [Lachnospiraceae bacterium]|nr:TatD family hydrolase [Lachnospiraceae bacterium]
MIFDTHAHYDNPSFDEDRDGLLASLSDAGIGRVVNVGASLESTKRTLKLMEEHSFIYGAAGVHPSECGEITEQDMVWLESVCDREKLVAIGEIGLDYYWKEPNPALQKRWFVRQLAMARNVHLPVIIHSRDAAKETLDIMKAEKSGDMGGVIHCFSYSREIAGEYLAMGFYLGIGGVSTFQNARQIKEVIAYAPLDRLVLETDCPYLAPVPYRGKRNSSLYLPLIIDAIAQIKGVETEQVEKQTWENGNKLFRLPQARTIAQRHLLSRN